MIKVVVTTTTLRRREVNVDRMSTPASVFESLGVNVTGNQVSLDGTTLRNLNSTFADLGVAEGGTVSLNAVVKADGAR